jgi:hypothetical protein
MRRKVDDTELDEVYLEEDEPEEPLLPPSPVAPSGQTTTGQPLQMVEAPALRTPPATPPTVAVSDGNAAAPPPAPTPAEPAAPPPADGGPPLG